jgi:hypothetical protein
VGDDKAKVIELKLSDADLTLNKFKIKSNIRKNIHQLIDDVNETIK